MLIDKFIRLKHDTERFQRGDEAIIIAYIEQDETFCIRSRDNRRLEWVKRGEFILIDRLTETRSEDEYNVRQEVIDYLLSNHFQMHMNSSLFFMNGFFKIIFSKAGEMEVWEWRDEPPKNAQFYLLFAGKGIENLDKQGFSLLLRAFNVLPLVEAKRLEKVYSRNPIF